jgi:hypothetical protein
MGMSAARTRCTGSRLSHASLRLFDLCRVCGALPGRVELFREDSGVVSPLPGGVCRRARGCATQQANPGFLVSNSVASVSPS